jgi:hypothetical protein
MKNRRSFLKMLGLGAVAAPVAARLAVEAEAVQMDTYVVATWLTDHCSRVQRSEHLLGQQEINRRRSAALKMLNENHRLWISSGEEA